MPTGRSELRRIPSRGSHDFATICEILDAAFLAHVGFQIEGQPFVIPMLYGRNDDKLYLHGSAASRILNRLSTGVAACVTVTIVDGVVLARSAFHHSMNYRSVVAFGKACRLEDPEAKARALRTMSEHLLVGRWEDVRKPTEQELKATSVLELSIEEASAKIRQGPPIDEEEDYNLQVWAGVLPLRLEAQAPIADTRMRKCTEVPRYLLNSQYTQCSSR